MFYVLEGAITFQCGEDRFDLEKGGFIFLPHGYVQY
jgi:quercetin dioxygenase-like cupin family protein